MSDVDALANAIREVDGQHQLGAAALAEALLDKGYALVKLPNRKTGKFGAPVWPVTTTPGAEVFNTRTGRIASAGVLTPYASTEDAEAHAAALLAAARSLR